MHMLWLQLRDLDVMQRPSVIRVGRSIAANQIVAILNRAGIPVTMEAVLRQAAGGAVGRPAHCARDGGRRVGAGISRSFDKWIGAGKPAYVPRSNSRRQTPLHW